MVPGIPKTRPWYVCYAMHVIAMGLACAAGIFVSILVESQYGSDQPLIVDCLPQIAIAAAVAYVLNGRLHSRTVSWVWVPPLVFAMLLSLRLPARGWWGAYISQNCGPTHCFYEVFGTGPLLAAIGYAIAGRIRYVDAEPAE